MDIITRGDFDGLACSVLISTVETIKEIKFVHPKDAQDGLAKASQNDIVINLPYIPGCGMWFDHHVSESANADDMPDFKGKFDVAPSCARVIYDYYKSQGNNSLDKFETLIKDTDSLDSAQLTMDDIIHPEGWILLGLTLDPRSGLGPEFRQYFRWLVEYIKELPLEKVLNHPEVSKRTNQVLNDQEAFNNLIKKHSHVDNKVIITDFRDLSEKPIGNRFLVYAIYPEAETEVRIIKGFKDVTVIAVGHSIFNRSSKVNIGEMLHDYGGGGHFGAGTTQVKNEDSERIINEIVTKLNA